MGVPHEPECEICKAEIERLLAWVKELQALTIDLSVENEWLKQGIPTIRRY